MLLSRRHPVVRGVMMPLWLLLASAAVQPAQAQLEVLLRGVEPRLPVAGTCGLYRFESREPDGDKKSTFVACVESVPASGPVVLQLSSGDTLEVRVEVGRGLFTAPGAQLSDHILSVERTQNGETQRLTPADWQKHPALAPAAPLPVRADSTLGQQTRTLESGDALDVQGRHRWESQQLERMLGEVRMTTNEDRRMDVWSAPQGPILGVVLAEATVRSERIFSEPIPGVPARGPRVMHYRLELLEILQPE